MPDDDGDGDVLVASKGFISHILRFRHRTTAPLSMMIQAS